MNLGAEDEEEVNTVSVLMEEQKILTTSGTQEKSSKFIKNMLYNIIVEIDIPGIQKFPLRAILDTGATTCCVDLKAVPAEALEENTFVVQFSGINSQQTARMKLKAGRMIIGDNIFRIPYTYSFPMTLGDSIQMIIVVRVAPDFYTNGIMGKTPKTRNMG